MAVYDLGGNEINAVYGSDGTALSFAYDTDGNVVFSDATIPDIKVMSYNVQWFSGINSQSAMLQKIFNDNNPDIIGMQEITNTGTVATVGLNALSNYPYLTLSYHKNYNALCSKIVMSNVVIADYEAQDDYDITEYGETRCYMKGYINVKGKQVCWINTHLCVHTASVRYEQMLELFNIAEQEEYAIITGDFNCSPHSVEDEAYINAFKQWVDAGYNLANCSPTAGFINTQTSATNPASLADLTRSLDNIITTGNIDIISVVFDTTKFEYLNGSPFDHIPVVAELTIN